MEELVAVEQVHDQQPQPMKASPLSSQSTRALGLRVTFVSFGHKHGVPEDTHHDFNLRKLPIPEVPGKRLKDLTGLNQDLQSQFFSNPKVEKFYRRLVDSIQELIDGKMVDPNEDEDSHVEMRIGLGCHSGQHRSVAIVERLASERWTSFDGRWSEVVTQKEHPHINLKSNVSKKQQRRKSRDKKYNRNNGDGSDEDDHLDYNE